MQEVKIEKAGRTYVAHIPGTIHEIPTKKAFVNACQIIFSTTKENVKENRVKLLYHAAINRKVFRFLKPAQQMKILELVDELFKPHPNESFTLGNFFLLVGPKPNFENLSFDQIRWAEEYLGAYNATKDVKYLYFMAAALYRFRFFGFSLQLSLAVAYLFRKRLKKYLPAVLLSYLSVKAAQKDLYPDLYEGAGDSSQSTDWFELMTDIAGAELGDLEKVKRMKAPEAFMYMNKLVKRSKKQPSHD